MKTLLFLMLLGLASVGHAQTNFVTVENTEPILVKVADDSAICSADFNSGLMIGATIAAGLFCFWMLRTIPGGSEECE